MVRKNRMKKIISAGVLFTTTSLMALMGEQAYLYKDGRIMGMGGANVAVGGYSTSIFSNPAGLINIKKEHGFVVDLLGVGVGASPKLKDFADDIDEAGDDSDKVATVIDEYSGEAFHLGINSYSAVSKNSSLFAWSVGLLSAVDVNLVVHGNGSTSGAPLETSSRGYGGIFIGGAKEYVTEYGDVTIGIGLKYVAQRSYEGAVYISDLTDDNATDIVQERYERDASGFGIDIGVIYKPLEDSYWHPAFGLSVLNIGAMDMDDNYGGQPLSVNIGASISPEVSYIESLVVAIDYVDVFNANKIRIYSFDEDSKTQVHKDYTDGDIAKRVRLGVGVGLIDSRFFSAQLNGGFYQGSYTAGLNLEIAMLKLSFATYEEQLGTQSVDITDRRYMVQLGFGW